MDPAICRCGDLGQAHQRCSTASISESGSGLGLVFCESEIGLRLRIMLMFQVFTATMQL